MKTGDLVRYIDKGTNARWFHGKMGLVTSYVAHGFDGKSHCRVQWLNPVEYYDHWTESSAFLASKFEVLNESR